MVNDRSRYGFRFFKRRERRNVIKRTNREMEKKEQPRGLHGSGFRASIKLDAAGGIEKKKKKKFSEPWKGGVRSELGRQE